MMGSAMVNPDKLFFGVFGDLVFFYDMNVMGNRHVGDNVRILMINNGKGNEFRLYCHPCSIFGEDAEPYMAAAGHYGNKSSQLVKHYAEDLGYEYLTASTKEEFLANVEKFTDPVISKSMIFEVFTDTDSESDALQSIRNIVSDKSFELKKKIKSIVRDTVGAAGVNSLKKIIGK